MKNAHQTACRRLIRTVSIAVLALAYSGIQASSGATTLVVGPPAGFSWISPNFALSADVGDLDGDARPDVVVGFNFASPAVLLNNGTTAPFEGVQGQLIAPSDSQQKARAADLNGDGLLDVLAVGFNAPSRLYINNGTAAPFASAIGSAIGPGLAESSTDVAIADVNGDGFPDVAVSNTNQTVSRIYLNNGTAQPFDGVMPKSIGVEATYAADIVLADVDGSGRPDAVIAYDTIVAPRTSGLLIYRNNGTSDPFGGVTPLLISSGSSVDSIAAADLNQDGLVDLLLGAGLISRNRVFLNTGSATQPFDGPASLEDLSLHSCLATAVADVDNDALPDAIFLCSSSDDPEHDLTYGAIYLNNGTADPYAGVTPTRIETARQGVYSWSVVAADLDSDGMAELLVSRDGKPFILPLTIDQNPVAADDRAATPAGNAIDVDVLANDSDADGILDRRSLTIVDAPLHGIAQINVVGHAIRYEPDNGFSGVDRLTYTVKDELGAVSGTATVEIVVQAPPLANDDAATTPANSAVSVNVLANDSSRHGSLVPATLSLLNAPSHGSADIDVAHAIRYVPAAGFSGTDTFKYSVQDNLGQVSNTGTVTIIVSSPPTSPPAPPSSGNGGGGGGGAVGWPSILCMAVLAMLRQQRRRRAARHECGGES